jgi:hypothetical protein
MSRPQTGWLVTEFQPVAALSVVRSLVVPR